MTTALPFLAALVTLAATAVTAETFGGGAVGHGTSANTVTPVTDTHIVMHSANSYEHFEVEEGHPLQGASGPCFGAVEIKEGTVTGGGRCAFATASGDTAVMAWTASGLGEGGALTGNWTVSGGSGAWATASGSGTFSSASDPATGTFVNTIAGAITMP